MPESAVDRFAGFARQVLILDSGRPFVVERFQRTMLEPFFAGARESVIVLPKANAKTTAVAGVGLYHLATTPEAEAIIVASSRDQAAILLDAVRGFVRRNPALARQLAVTQRTVTYPRLGGRLRVLSADANTADGTIPSLAVCDELHRHRSGELYAVLRDGLDKRGGQMLTISTAGIRGESPLWDLRERALALPSARRDGCRVTAHSADGQFALMEWSLSDGMDPDDMGVVKGANPLSIHSVASLRERHDSPSTIPSEWKRFGCNMWVERAEVEAVIDGPTWAALLDTEASPLPPLCLAIDSTMDQSAAAVAIAGFVDERGERALVDLVEHGSGLAWSLERVVELSRRHETTGCVVDPGGPAAALIPRLEERAINVIQTSTREVSMASTGFLQAVTSGTVCHRGAEPLTASVQGAVKRSLAQTWAFDRRRSLADPSPLMAAVLALYGLQAYGPIGQGAFDATYGEGTIA
jgi:type IV secretory pathway protease TraF